MNAFKFFPIVLLIGIVALYSSGNYASEAHASGIKSSSVVSIKAIGYGNNKQIAIKDAELTAIKQLLFEGVSGSAHALPLVSDPESAKMEFGLYFSELFNERYSKFIESKEFIYQAGLRGRNSVNLALTVDIEGLRQDLEANNIN